MVIVLTFCLSDVSSFLLKSRQYNFVGRLLGPRGNSLKRVEALTECRVYIRGKGSIKDALEVLKKLLGVCILLVFFLWLIFSNVWFTYFVEHNSLWVTLALFINTNWKEITKHLVENIQWAHTIIGFDPTWLVMIFQHILLAFSYEFSLSRLWDNCSIIDFE